MLRGSRLPAVSSGRGWRPRRSGSGRGPSCRRLRCRAPRSADGRAARVCRRRPSRRRVGEVPGPRRWDLGGDPPGPCRGAGHRQSSHMPLATGTCTRRGPSSAAIARRSDSVNSPRLCTSRPVRRRRRRWRPRPGRRVESRDAGGALEFGEPLEDHVLLVAQDQEGDRDLVGGRRPEGRDPVLGRALARTQMTGREGWASWTPTAAAMPKPRPPLELK